MKSGKLKFGDEPKCFLCIYFLVDEARSTAHYVSCSLVPECVHVSSVLGHGACPLGYTAS